MGENIIITFQSFKTCTFPKIKSVNKGFESRITLKVEVTSVIIQAPEQTKKS